MVPRHAKGFTLVELMVVVAIIGILAALAVPAFRRFVKHSKAGEADLLMTKIANGAKAYYLSEQRYSPSSGREPWHQGNANTGLDTSYGMPRDRDRYVFPGGNRVREINMLYYTPDVLACDQAPNDGVKMVPDEAAAEALANDEVATLHLLGGILIDPTYFGVDYLQSNSGLNARARIRALSDFQDGGPCHTVTIQMTVDNDSREVLVAPSYIVNNLE